MTFPEPGFTSSAALFGSLAVLALLFGALWLASLPLRDASLVDRVWGMAFVVLAVWYSWTRPDAPMPAPGLALALLVSIWGMRLSIHLTRRNWGRGEDYRYAAMRARQGARFGLMSLGTVFLLQAVLVWVIGMPLFAGIRGEPIPGAPGILLTAAGILVWLVGFLFETVGDWQLARHRADPTRQGQVLDTGLWRYTRHPNYFGDAAVWWGLWLLAAAAGGWWTAFGPMIMTFFLMKVSGVTLLEKQLVEKRPGYREYVARTSAFIPRPPNP
jgi:steroid 5-alpha reductase family enzyme